MVKKTIISVLIAFSITILLFIIFMNYYHHHNDLENVEKKFYSQNQPTEKRKIIFLGDSQTGMINATYINNQLLENNCCIVYNLAIAADRPEKRLETINQIIALKPDLVVYGIGFLEFENMKTPAFEKPKSFLPDPENVFNDLLSQLNFSDFDSPKFVTLKAIRSSENNDTIVLVTDHYTPFFPYDLKKEGIVKSDKELEQNLKITKFNPIDPIEHNKGVAALKEIIQKLRTNNIKVVIFTTPFNKYYLDNMPESYNVFLESMLKMISNEYNMKTYDLQNKYSQLHIWYDIVHVVINKNITVYNDDIVKIILNEVNN